MTNYRVDSSFPSSKMVKIPMDDVQSKQVYSLSDLQMGDTAGTTETDSKTDKPVKGYSRINSKGGY